MKYSLLFSPLLLVSVALPAQKNQKVTRIANLIIDSASLPVYMKLLDEQMQTAVKAEPGVLDYNVYADKADLTKLTIVEVYASDKAYRLHREAADFLKYKAATAGMVKSLVLTEVKPVLHAGKPL